MGEKTGKLIRNVPLWAVVASLLIGFGSASAVLVTFLRLEVPCTATVAVSGNLAVTPNPISFGTIAPSSSVSVTVVVKNNSNRDCNVTVWSTLSGNPNLSLLVRNPDGSAYASRRLAAGGSMSLVLVLSASANAKSGLVTFMAGFDGVDEG